MPFTPLHFGIALPFCFWDWKYKRVDVITALIATVIVDARSTVLFLFFGVRDMAQLHSTFHNFLVAALLGVGVAVFVQLTQRYWNWGLRWVKWDQQTPFWSKILVGIGFAWSHVLLDGALYSVMAPFWPFMSGNPLYLWISMPVVYGLCTYGFIVGFLLFVGSLIYHNAQNENGK